MQQQLDKLIAAVTIAPAPSAPPPEVATAPAASPPTDTLPVVSPPAPLGGVPPRAHLEPAAELPTIDEGNAEADDAAELELEEMLEQLSVDPASSVNFADAFGGHPLPVPLFEGDADHQPNPYPRTPSFRNRTSHYAPAVAGDGLHGELCKRLESMGNGCELYAYEARSLVSSCSYSYDMREQLRFVTTIMAEAKFDEILHPDLHGVPALLAALTVQANSVLEHKAERLDALRQIAFGGADDIALFAKLYNNEQRVTGAGSRLGRAADSLRDSSQARLHVVTAARARAKSAAERMQIKGLPGTITGAPRAGRRTRGGGSQQNPNTPRAGASAPAAAASQRRPQSQSPPQGTQTTLPAAASQHAAANHPGRGQGGGRGAAGGRGGGRGSGGGRGQAAAATAAGAASG